MENALNLLFSLKNSITPMCAPSKLCGFGRGAPPPGCPRRQKLGRRAPSRCPWGKGAQLQAQVSCNPCTPAPLPSALCPHDSCAAAQGRWPKAAAAAALLQSQRGVGPGLQLWHKRLEQLRSGNAGGCGDGRPAFEAASRAGAQQQLCVQLCLWHRRGGVCSLIL